MIAFFTPFLFCCVLSAMERDERLLYTQYTDYELKTLIKLLKAVDPESHSSMAAALCYRSFYTRWNDTPPNTFDTLKKILPYIRAYRDMIAKWEELRKVEPDLPEKECFEKKLQNFQSIAVPWCILAGWHNRLDLEGYGLRNLHGLREVIGDSPDWPQEIGLWANPLDQITAEDCIEFQGLLQKNIRITISCRLPFFAPGAWGSCIKEPKPSSGKEEKEQWRSLMLGGVFWRTALPILGFLRMPSTFIGIIGHIIVLPFSHRPQTVYQRLNNQNVVDDALNDLLTIGCAAGIGRLFGASKKAALCAAVPLIITQLIMAHRPHPKSLPIRYGVYQFWRI